MPEPRRKFDAELRVGAVRIATETGHAVAQVARELGVGEGALGSWVRRDAAERAGGLSADERAELVRLRKENAAGNFWHHCVRPRSYPPPTRHFGAQDWIQA